MKLNNAHENNGYQTRRQALISLALQKDVAFPDANSIVNELPPLNITYSNSIKSAAVTFDELPPISPTVIPTSARTFSTITSAM